MTNELRAAFLKLHNRMRDASWIPGRLGLLNSDGSYTLAVSGKPGWVHVRMGPDGSQGHQIAFNRGVPLHRNLRVRMLRESGSLVIYGIDSHGGATQTGGGATLPGHAWMHDRLGPDPLYIRGLAFLPLAARPTTPPSMAVTVERAFYRYGDDIELWDTGDTSSLSSYVPSSPIVQHFVVVSLNRGTGALTITDGNDAPSVDGSPPFTASDVLSVVQTIGDSDWPIAAIRFYNGQTAIRSADVFMDLRLWGGEIAEGGASVSSSGWTVDYAAIIPSGKDAFIPGRVLVESSGTLTVNGELFVV